MYKSGQAEIMLFLMEQFMNKCCTALDEKQLKSIEELNEKDIKTIEE